MKTRIATTLILLVLTMGSVMALNPVPANKATRASVVKLIEQNMEYPVFAVDNKIECCVVVSMTITEQGTLKVIASNSLSPSMQRHVVSTIEKLSDDKLVAHAGEQVLVKVRFQLLS